MKNKLNNKIREEFEKILYESICIKGNNGKCDRSQESRLYVDIKNIREALDKAFFHQRQEIIKIIKEKNKEDNVIENYDDILKKIDKL